MYVVFDGKCLLFFSDFNQNRNFLTNVAKHAKKFHKSSCVDIEVVPCERANVIRIAVAVRFTKGPNKQPSCVSGYVGAQIPCE
jgi:hypothetical protein